MQILLVHNWNCVTYFGNMFDINLKKVILETRIWSFSYWHNLRSFCSCVYTTASLGCASQTHFWRVRLCVLAPCWKDMGLHTMPLQSWDPFKWNPSIRGTQGAVGWWAGESGRWSTRGLLSRPSHSWHPLLGMWVAVASSARGPRRLLVCWKCVLGKNTEEGQACSVAPSDILLCVCSLLSNLMRLDDSLKLPSPCPLHKAF